MTATSLYETLTNLAKRFETTADEMSDGARRAEHRRMAQQLRLVRTLVLNGTHTPDYGWSFADAAAGQLIRNERSNA